MFIAFGSGKHFNQWTYLLLCTTQPYMLVLSLTHWCRKCYRLFMLYPKHILIITFCPTMCNLSIDNEAVLQLFLTILTYLLRSMDGGLKWSTLLLPRFSLFAKRKKTMQKENRKQNFIVKSLFLCRVILSATETRDSLTSHYCNILWCI